MSDSQEEVSRHVLIAATKSARANFAELVKKKKVAGNFDGPVWNYRGIGLIFCEHTSRNRGGKTPLGGASESLAKCYMVSEMMRGVTPSCAIGHLNAFRMLAWTVEKNKRQWHTLGPSVFDSTVEWLRLDYKESTVYNRAGGLVAFLTYVNRVTAPINGTVVPFLRRSVSWKHGVRNPIRDDEDPTSDKFTARREDLYRADVHTALATARFKVTSEPSLEPSSGYDRIRLEALAFMLSLGIRVGELCALPINAYERDSDTGLPFVRVPVEKTREPAAIPLGTLWEEAVSSAYAYLLEMCASARRQAFEIEQRGFSFIYDKLSEKRQLKPLSNAQSYQLSLSGLDSRNHFLISEWTDAFDVSHKEFVSDGRFRSAIVAVPKPVAASAVAWIDERVELWDWSEYAQRSASGKLYGCGLSIFSHAGIPDSTIQKPGLWFRAELIKFLQKLVQIGAFEGVVPPSSGVLKAVRNSWAKLRENMLSHKGGAHSTFINADKVIQILREHYDRWLEVHYGEIVDSSLDLASGERGPKIGRVGMPQKLSEHLIVVWEGQFNKLSAKGLIPRPILRKDFYQYLSKGDDRKTIFERLEIKDA